VIERLLHPRVSPEAIVVQHL